MADNITKGKWNQVKGKVREEAGKLTGNTSQEIRGEAEQVAGKVQEEYGKAKRNIKKAIGD
ncbi:MAG: CsbD family protein [Chloroflexi bacterium]|nr:CsbD family protein [Chloroflexota bacterium]